MSAGISRLLRRPQPARHQPAPAKPAPERPARKRISLALQGGGAHGAFTWGVLDYLLEDGRLEFSGLSGASAGAVNAVMLADGLARGGREEARRRLADFWRAASIDGRLPDAHRAMVDRARAMFPMPVSPLQAFVHTMSRWMSPYEFNPLNINPLRDLIARLVDFEAVRNFGELELYIAATNVRSGQLHVFRSEEVSADAVMASAALPHMFRAVEIDGEPYWDGGFTGNPPILPLLTSGTDDILLVQISPLRRDDTPKTTRDILSRVSEISFSSSLAAELRALDYIARHSPSAYAGPNVHRIRLGGLERKIGAASRLKTDYDFFALLHRAGRRAARRFLDRHFDDIGQRSTFDLAKETAA